MSEPYVSVEEDGTCWSDDGIPCPHCKTVHDQDLSEITGAYSEGGELDCHNCGKEFTFSVYISHSWTSRFPKKATNDH